MGYRLDSAGFARAVADLSGTYRVLAPVVKTGKGRFTDTDVVLYDEVKDGSEICLTKIIGLFFQRSTDTAVGNIIFLHGESGEGS